jgi:hypothetical protein
VPEIEIIELHTDTGTGFVLKHPYDLSLLDCDIEGGQFADRAGAERAAARIITAVTGGAD